MISRVGKSGADKRESELNLMMHEFLIVDPFCNTIEMEMTMSSENEPIIFRIHRLINASSANSRKKIGAKIRVKNQLNARREGEERKQLYSIEIMRRGWWFVNLWPLLNKAWIEGTESGLVC